MSCCSLSIAELCVCAGDFVWLAVNCLTCLRICALDALMMIDWAALLGSQARLVCSPKMPKPHSRDRGWPKVTFAQLIARGPKGPPAGEGLPHMSAKHSAAHSKCPVNTVNSAKPNLIDLPQITDLQVVRYLSICDFERPQGWYPCCGIFGWLVDLLLLEVR